MKYASPRNTVLKGVAALALVAMAAGTPRPSHGITLDNGPDVQRVDIDALFRMNDDTLFRLSQSIFVLIPGKMGRFNTTTVIRAIQFAPGRTQRLIRRIEKAGTDAKALAIVDEQIDALGRQEGVYGRFSRPASSENPELAAYRRLLMDMSRVLDLAEQRRLDLSEIFGYY